MSDRSPILDYATWNTVPTYVAPVPTAATLTLLTNESGVPITNESDVPIEMDLPITD